MEYIELKDENFDNMFSALQSSVADRSAKIVFKGQFDAERDSKAISKTKGFTTYFIFYFSPEFVNLDDEESIWKAIEGNVRYGNWPELVQKAYTYQIIDLQFFDVADIESEPINFKAK